MLTAKQEEGESPSRKRAFDDHGGEDRGRSPSPSRSRTVESQDVGRCEPDNSPSVHSPPSEDLRVRTTTTDYYKNQPHPMDTDSPSSYPKQIMVPATNKSTTSNYQKEPPMRAPQHDIPYRQHRDQFGSHDHLSSTETPPSHISRNIVTPNINTPERTGMPAMHHNYHSPPPYRPSNYHSGHGPGPTYGGSSYYGNDSPHCGSPYEMDVGPGHGHHYYYHGGPSGVHHRDYHGDFHRDHYADGPNDHHHQAYPGGSSDNLQARPKRWACDICRVAKFSTYEAAMAHEEVCRQRHEDMNRSAYQPPSPHSPPHGEGGPRKGGLGALYHASQEVQHNPAPRSPPRDHPAWIAPPSRGAPPPVPPERAGYTLSPRFGRSFRGSGGYGDRYDGANGHVHLGNEANKNSKRMLLAMSSDSDSLSDRQCYVRSDFVEIFTATEKDVSARHSKGAQRLSAGQVGIRCMHCAHLRPKDRAERAVCYPSSVSRIYQTVADMQRFHFEQCDQIPDGTLRIYKSLKTTRPRGVGSPQTYWIQSAKLIGLTDTDQGIRFGNRQESEPSRPEEVTPS